MSNTIKYLSLSLSSGICLGLAWPTGGFTFLIFGALIPLLYLEDKIRVDSSKRKVLRLFIYSYLSFLTWNLITTWWLYNSTLFGMLFANFCNSLFYAIIFLLYFWAKKRLPLRSAYIFLITVWLSFEKLHLVWDFSWTWLNLGNVFSEKIYWIQWYEYTGTFGGSLWVLILNLWFYDILKDQGFKVSKLMIRKFISPLLLIGLPIALSLYIYRQVETPEKNINIILMQPNIDPYNNKYKLTNSNYLKKFITESKPYLTKKTQYILLPETYFTEGYGEELNNYSSSKLHKEIQKFLSDFPNLQFITGIQFYDIYLQKEAPSITSNLVREDFWAEFYNSALSEQYQKKPEIYHKSKLVVGVENMPFKSILKPLFGEIMIDLGGTVSSRATQDERSVFFHQSQQEKAAPIICYESIFGEFVTDYIKEGATFLTVISNDAWWGRTPGHRQLLSYTRLRAIETRRDIARSANTGISAFIDARGEILQKTDYNKKTILNGTIASRSEITFYTRFGDLIARWAILFAGILLLISISGRLKKK